MIKRKSIKLDRSFYTFLVILDCTVESFSIIMQFLGVVMAVVLQFYAEVTESQYSFVAKSI